MILVFLIIVGGALLLGSVFKEKLENTIPAFMLLIIFVLYMSGLIFNLSIGFFLVVALAAGGAILTSYKLAKKESRSEAVKDIFCPSLLIFATLCVFVFIINLTRQFGHWDEFSHWGPMIRETFRLNDFHNQIGSSLYVHRNYPPAITLFQYFFLRLAGGFSQQDTYRALQLLTLSLMLPAFAKVKSKLTIGCVFIVMLFLPDAFGNSTYLSIYTDTVLGVLLGYSIFLVVVKNDGSVFNLMNLFLVSMTIVLTKQMGLLLVLIPVMILIIQWIAEVALVSKKTNHNKKQTFNKLKSIGIIIVGTVVGQLTWSARLTSVNVTGGQFSVGDIIRNTFELLTGNIQPHQTITFVGYVEAFFNRSLIHFMGLTLFSLFIILSIGAILLHVYLRKQKRDDQLLSLAIGTPLSIGMYVVVMLFMYMVAFCEVEGPVLASYHRYMTTVLIGFGVGFFLIVMNLLLDRENPKGTLRWKVLIFTGVFCVLAIPGWAYYQILFSGLAPRADLEQEFIVHHSALFEGVNLEEDKVYLIVQGSTGEEFWRIRFYANPLHTNEIFTWSIGSLADEGHLWTASMDAKQWSEKLLTNGFDFVYLYEVNQQFREEFGELFYNQEDINNNVLVRVTEEGGRALLILEQ